MRNNRLIGFLVSILIGVILGCIYGWFINPAKPSSSYPLETLRNDFQTDYVLMIAQTYQFEHDTELARSRLLAITGDNDIVPYCKQTVINAQKLNYSEADIAVLNGLVQALQNQPQSNTTPTKGS